MFSKQTVIASLAAVGVLGAAALTIDVDIRVKNAWAEAATTAAGEWSPVKPNPNRSVYYPGTEALDPDEMRVIACGSGMPMPRAQAGRRRLPDRARQRRQVHIRHGHWIHGAPCTRWGFRWTSPTRSSSRICTRITWVTWPSLLHLRASEQPLGAAAGLGSGRRRDAPGVGYEGSAWTTWQGMWAWMSGTLAGTIDTQVASHSRSRSTTGRR